jgi:co-chaperonin GroES (HSP10)
MNAAEFEGAGLAQHQSRNGLNTSGLSPVEYKILIAPENVETVSAGGIVMATATTDRDKMAQVRGKLVAIGGNAFEDWAGMTPEVGDMVYYAKYAGLMVKGEDGREYRLANDKDITAIIAKGEQA